MYVGDLARSLVRHNVRTDRPFRWPTCLQDRQAQGQVLFPESNFLTTLLGTLSRGPGP